MWLLDIALVTILVSMTAIVAYSLGHEAGRGKPKLLELMVPGTQYAFCQDFVEIRANGSRGYRALLKNLNNGLIEYCAPRQPLPATQVIVAKDEFGKICLLPAPIASPKPEPEPTHVDLVA